MRKLGLLVFVLTAASGLLASPGMARAQSPLDPNLPGYHPHEKLSGKLTLSGSTTMAQLATVWSEGFRQFHPDVEVIISVTGAVQAVDSVASSEADIGLLSRAISPSEVASFQGRFNYPPTVLTPTYESISVFVPGDNPIAGLTLQQLDAIFSTTRLRGADKTPATWGDLGVKGALASQPIVCFGRKPGTGVQVFFQDTVLGGGEFRADLQVNQSNADVMKIIASTPNSIGFAGSNFATPDVRAVPLSVEAGQPFVAVDSIEATRGLYPLIRPLQLVINQAPGAELPALQAEFVKYVFSRFGQEDVLRSGLHPITARPAQTTLDAVGLGTAK